MTYRELFEAINNYLNREGASDRIFFQSEDESFPIASCEVSEDSGGLILTLAEEGEGLSLHNLLARLTEPSCLDQLVRIQNIDGEILPCTLQDLEGGTIWVVGYSVFSGMVLVPVEQTEQEEDILLEFAGRPIRRGALVGLLEQTDFSALYTSYLERAALSERRGELVDPRNDPLLALTLTMLYKTETDWLDDLSVELDYTEEFPG